jgi:hypothetical protein
VAMLALAFPFGRASEIEERCCLLEDASFSSKLVSGRKRFCLSNRSFSSKARSDRNVDVTGSCTPGCASVEEWARFVDVDASIFEALIACSICL